MLEDALKAAFQALSQSAFGFETRLLILSDQLQTSKRTFQPCQTLAFFYKALNNSRKQAKTASNHAVVKLVIIV